MIGGIGRIPRFIVAPEMKPISDDLMPKSFDPFKHK
jgi:hypothetical protein